MTSTLIKGTVNQSDPNAENGYYTIDYFSEDLKNWTHISDIAAAENNLEDVDIMADGDVIRVTYERETRTRRRQQSFRFLQPTAERHGAVR